MEDIARVAYSEMLPGMRPTKRAEDHRTSPNHRKQPMPERAALVHLSRLNDGKVRGRPAGTWKVLHRLIVFTSA